MAGKKYSQNIRKTLPSPTLLQGDSICGRNFVTKSSLFIWHPEESANKKSSGEQSSH